MSDRSLEQVSTYLSARLFVFEVIDDKIIVHRALFPVPEQDYSGKWVFGCIAGVGRRKSAVARVCIGVDVDKPGLMTVNGKYLDEYFQYNLRYVNTAISPLSYLNLTNKYNISIRVSGGGIKGQADAIKLGIARCLCSIYPDIARRKLKALGYIRQDARRKERKKYGLLKARKAPQYSKR